MKKESNQYKSTLGRNLVELKESYMPAKPKDDLQAAQTPKLNQSVVIVGKDTIHLLLNCLWRLICVSRHCHMWLAALSFPTEMLTSL